MIEVEGYTVVERIGAGGAGVVYRAVCRSTGMPVAVKVLRDTSGRSVAWHRTRRELTALVTMRGHPNVVQLFDVIEHRDGPALVMEYAPGGSVADLIERVGILGIGESLLVGHQTAAALAAAHAEGIVHRDVKPHNLLIDADGQVKLCDFGIASLTRDEEFRARTDAWSMRYASPEDLEGDVAVGPPSDVYSFGATLLHLVHGAPPTLKDRLAPWVPVHTGTTQAAELDALLAACLHPDPAARPTAPQLVDHLEAITVKGGERVRSLTTAATEPSSAEPSVRPPGGADPIQAPDGGLAVGSRFEPVEVNADGSRSLDDVAPALDPDATLHRPGRRSAPGPVVASRRRRRWPVVAGALVSAILVSGAVAMVSSGRREPSTVSAGSEDLPSAGSTVPSPVSEVPTTSDAPVVASTIVDAAGLQIVGRPSGLIPIDDDTIDWPFGAVGECLVQPAEGSVLQPVACSDPHDLQRYAVAELDSEQFPPDAAFDPAIVAAAVAEACASKFAAFAVPGPVAADLDRPVTQPSADTFEQGDRSFQCLVGSYGHRLIGDASHPRASPAER